MNGVISILKPPGMTSHDVVSFIRKVTGIKKVGHTGTLDPGAAGVLPVCIGKATKIVDYIMSDTKTYICELTLGNESDTYDKYGEFKHESPNKVPDIDENAFRVILKEFTGDISQKPPGYSAVKIMGKRAYLLARQGEVVDIPARSVTIHKIEILKYALPKVIIKIICSKGTYVRSLCSDIGKTLGCGAYMSFLLRSSTGRFNLENSYIFDEITKDNIEKLLISPDLCLDMDSITVSDSNKKSLLNGNCIEINSKSDYQNKLVKIYLSSNEFIGIGKIKDSVLFVEKLLY
jgi:tRNA pseudouridine55 synthase